ncbi:GNAT family N-acetyltransferase [Polaromonas sp. SM01]|uniref:GNAT family N-acetyltransferase n=1 Tax=Polaromonas sp. SM01 TaxID=3085630 RepID=UPI00298155D8|nr:GNAT family N-acyltransferase [Polaromonas sp. SM01]MDW5443522.1 GNAT family N-acyltransferase [Polaromonas sp. SM01]
MRDLPLPATPQFSPRPQASPFPQAAVRAGIVVAWARHTDEVRQAQRLRFEVFAGELGARLDTPLANHDIDRFDDYCEHLLVRDAVTWEVIGTYRVLTPAQARRAGGTYTDKEFDLVRLAPLRAHMVELGRSCVHARHRHGGVILALWRALAEFMSRNELDTMIGCASIPLRHLASPGGVGDGLAAASIWQQLRKTHLASPPYHVFPHLPLPLDRGPALMNVEPPALVKAYLRLGAQVLGPPAWDPDFNTADLPLMMRMADLPRRYRQHASGG